MNWLHDVLTVNDPDGKQYYDLVRCIVAIGFGTGIGLELFDVFYRGSRFDFVSFATAIGLIIGAGGGAMALRRDIEPPHRPDDDHG